MVLGDRGSKSPVGMVRVKGRDAIRIARCVVGGRRPAMVFVLFEEPALIGGLQRGGRPTRTGVNRRHMTHLP